MVPEYVLPTRDAPQIVRVRASCGWKWVSENDKLKKWQWANSGRNNVYFPEDVDTYHWNSGTKTETETEVDACLGDPNEFRYWSSGGDACPFEPNLSGANAILPWDDYKAISGPNLNRPTAIVPLSSNRRQVIQKIDHMHPVPGGTMADVGLMWGLRTLSPDTNWTNFWGLSGDQLPGGYTDPETIKVAILLTDGKNDAPIDYEGYYGCTKSNRGSGYDDGDVEDFEESADCWKSPDIQTLDKTALDNLTLDACTAMKDTYGIRIYSIAVDITDTDSINLLKGCASTLDDFYNISSGDIDLAFSSILTQVIRLSK